MNFDLFYYLYPKHYRIIYDPNTGHMLISSFSTLLKGDDLTQRIDNNGYLCVKLNNKTVKIHEIAAEIVLGMRPEGLVVNHIDGDKLNNTPFNLEYTTTSENTKHAYRIGLHKSERHGNFKDGRATKENLKKYKDSWYQQNKERILSNMKEKRRLIKEANEYS